jgi:preprotein translocase subunit SecA
MRNVQYSAPTDPVQGSSSIASAMAAEAELEMGVAGPPEAVAVNEPPVVQEPVRVEKTPGRNEPCFCGSGKKYKLCHGR